MINEPYIMFGPVPPEMFTPKMVTYSSVEGNVDMKMFFYSQLGSLKYINSEISNYYFYNVMSSDRCV